MSVMHYCGALQIYEKGGKVTDLLSGWPVCCSGDRCVAIKDSGWITRVKLYVTCKTCLQQIKRAEQSVATRGKRDAEGGS